MGMALRPKVLRIKAEKVEQKTTKKYKVNMEQVCVLDAMFRQYYTISRPELNEYKARTNLVEVFNEIAKDIYGKSGEVPTVVEFGSFVMDLFSVRSDLDLSVNFIQNGAEMTREKKIQTLRKFARKFYALQSKGHVFGVHPIPTAKVPILKVIDRGTRVECDLSVENRDGILKSQLIRLICSLDERFPILSLLMKAWAKAQKINSSKDGTLNSLSIVLLVAFHLQTRKPPILPAFGALFKDGIDLASVEKSLKNFTNYGKSNKESVAELFISLLIKLSSSEILWRKGLCASVYDGCWTSKTWDSKVASMSVEDFTDRAQNVARAVSVAEFKKIYKCIHNALKLVFTFMDGRLDSTKLLMFLFGKDAKLPSVTTQSHTEDATILSPGGVDTTNSNREVMTEGSGGTGIVKSSSILSKRASVDSRGEIPSTGWGKGECSTPSDTPIAGWRKGECSTPSDTPIAKRMRCTGDLG